MKIISPMKVCVGLLQVVCNISADCNRKYLKMHKLYELAEKAHKKIKNSYQSNDNPKWSVQIRIGSNIFFHVLNWCTSWNNCRHNSFLNYVCINIKEFLIKFNTKYGMISPRTVINIIWKRADKKKSQIMNLQMIKLVYLPDGLLWFRSSFCKTFTLALIELNRSWSGSLVVDWLDVVVAFWYGDRNRFGELILISGIPVCVFVSCTGEYSLNDSKSSVFIFTNTRQIFR